jgi:hypothetical protein
VFQGSTLLDESAIDYSVAVALAGAEREAGLSDFGECAFEEPLGRLIDASLRELRFTEVGLQNFKATIQRFLVNRLRLQRDLVRHPEILGEDVSDPIIVLGMPRTGTTKLQRLLSADPRNQKLALWKLLNPAPFPDDELPPDAARLAFAKIVEDATRANPDFTMSHETAADEADEDSFLLLFSFEYPMLHNIFPADSYLEWVRTRSPLTAHRFEHTLLQYLQWQSGGRTAGRWILKNPGHVGHLAALHAVFPRATYVHSHRDMVEVLASYCYLIESIYQPLYVDVDPREIGRQALLYWGPELERYARERAALGTQVSILDVPYRGITDDPYAIVREIYSRAGLSFTREAEAAMRAWSDRNRQHKHGKATYRLERYGLTPELIRRTFPAERAT